MNGIKLLTAQDANFKNGIGFIRKQIAKDTFEQHTHEFFELFLIHNGQAVHSINGSKQLMVEGSLVLIRPTDVHTYNFFNNYDMEILNMSFSYDLFIKACQILNCDPEIFLSSELPPHINLTDYNNLDVYKKLVEMEKYESWDEKAIYARSILPFLLHMFIKTNTVETQQVMPVWFAQLLEQMNKRENFVPGLDHMLTLCSISQEHLTRQFKKYTSMTPTEFINSKRMNLAAFLLLEEKLKVTDVCYECGYNNMSYFYKIFQKHFKCSPRHFANQKEL